MKGGSSQRAERQDGSRIGKSLHLKGTITAEEDLDIAGRFEGSIILSKNELVAGEDALVEADIQAGRVLIRGTVRGNVQGLQRVELTSTAKLTGELETREIRVEEGAIFRGQANIITDDD